MKRSRGLRLIKNITSSFVIRFGNLLAMAVMIPIAVNGLDNTNYSTFAVLISLSLAFTYADFGIGSAVVNSIGKDTDSRVAIVLSTATSILIMVAFISLIVMTVLYTMGVQNSDTYLALFLMAINLPFAIVHKVLLGDGRKYFSDMCMLLAKIIGLLGVFFKCKK
jgi:O-antigen/teichoic acid export membrane protein